MKKVYPILSWIGLIVCMVSIVCFSSQSGDDSGNLSGQIALKIVRIVSADETDAALFSRVHLAVRKLAHASEYFALSVLSVLAFGSFRLSIRERLLWAFLFCFAFAFSDEWHQTFVNGRSGEFADVAIDMCGASVGVLFGAVVLRLRRRR